MYISPVLIADRLAAGILWSRFLYVDMRRTQVDGKIVDTHVRIVPESIKEAERVLSILGRVAGAAGP